MTWMSTPEFARWGSSRSHFEGGRWRKPGLGHRTNLRGRRGRDLPLPETRAGVRVGIGLVGKTTKVRSRRQ